MVTVAFVRVEDAGRSQMAAAFAQRQKPRGIRIRCGGTHPAAHVHPAVVAAMKGVGVNLSRVKPRAMTRDEVLESDIFVTMGCASGDVCPATFRGDTIDWAFPDPAGKSVEEVRRIRDEIERRLTALLGEVMRGR